MNKVRSIAAALLMLAFLVPYGVDAQRKRKSTKAKTTYVKSYTKKNGKTVKSHYRSKK